MRSEKNKVSAPLRLRAECFLFIPEGVAIPGRVGRDDGANKGGDGLANVVERHRPVAGERGVKAVAQIRVVRQPLFNLALASGQTQLDRRQVEHRHLDLILKSIEIGVGPVEARTPGDIDQTHR